MSLKLATTPEATDAFGRIVGLLGRATGDVRVRHDRCVWIDACPMPSETPVEQQLRWAAEEAEIVFGSLTEPLPACELDVRVGLSVDAQLGVELEADAIARWGRLGFGIVLDIYGEG